MTAKREIAPELLAEARRLYEQTAAPVADIADMLGLSRSRFYERARAGGWRSRQAKPTFSFARAVSASLRPPAAPESEAPAAPANCEPVSPQQRMAVAQRIMNTVEYEIDAIIRILRTIAPTDQLEAEHGARTLTSVSRALREIQALIRSDNETPSDDANADDDPVPRDIDEFRLELARRVRDFIEAQPGAAAAVLSDREPDMD